MRRFVRVALALVSLTLVAATSAQAEKRVAPLIGNTDYKAGVGVLASPLNDIRIVGAALKSIGFEGDGACAKCTSRGHGASHQ